MEGTWTLLSMGCCIHRVSRMQPHESVERATTLVADSRSGMWVKAFCLTSPVHVHTRAYAESMWFHAGNSNTAPGLTFTSSTAALGEQLPAEALHCEFHLGKCVYTRAFQKKQAPTLTSMSSTAALRCVWPDQAASKWADSCGERKTDRMVS